MSQLHNVIAKVCSGHTKREKKGLTLSHLTVLVKPQAAQIYLQSVHPNVLRIVQYCISRHEKPLHCYVRVVKCSELGQNVLSSMGGKRTSIHYLNLLPLPQLTLSMLLLWLANFAQGSTLMFPCNFVPAYNFNTIFLPPLASIKLLISLSPLKKFPFTITLQKGC